MTAADACWNGHWSAAGSGRIAEMLDYASWLATSAATLSPPVALLDTTDSSVDATARDVCDWLARVMS